MRNLKALTSVAASGVLSVPFDSQNEKIKGIMIYSDKGYCINGTSKVNIILNQQGSRPMINDVALNVLASISDLENGLGAKSASASIVFIELGPLVLLGTDRMSGTITFTNTSATLADKISVSLITIETAINMPVQYVQQNISGSEVFNDLVSLHIVKPATAFANSDTASVQLITDRMDNSSYLYDYMAKSYLFGKIEETTSLYALEICNFKQSEMANVPPIPKQVTVRISGTTSGMYFITRQYMNQPVMPSVRVLRQEMAMDFTKAPAQIQKLASEVKRSKK